MSLESGVEPKGVIATNINPKLVGGKKQLPATLGPLCYRNKFLAIIQTFVSMFSYEKSTQVLETSWFTLANYI